MCQQQGSHAWDAHQLAYIASATSLCGFSAPAAILASPVFTRCRNFVKRSLVPVLEVLLVGLHAHARHAPVVYLVPLPR